MEACPSLVKERVWKARKPAKSRFVGSNPTASSTHTRHIMDRHKIRIGEKRVRVWAAPAKIGSIPYSKIALRSKPSAGSTCEAADWEARAQEHAYRKIVVTAVVQGTVLAYWI